MGRDMAKRLFNLENLESLTSRILLVCEPSVTMRKIVLNIEFLPTQKMRLPQKWVHHDTLQPMWVEPFQNLYWGSGLAWIILIHSKGFGRAQPI